MKIVFFEVMPGEQESLAKHLPPDTDAHFLDERLTADNAAVAADADIVSVFVKSEVPAAVIDLLPKVKLITTRSMGYDHIDLAHAKSKGIKVNNVQSYASHPVAEFTFALLLMVARKMYPAANHLRDGNVFDVRGLTGYNLFGKTMGIVGTGRIGKNVAQIARGFGMTVIASDAHPDDAHASQYGYTYAPLPNLLAQSDIVSLHVPFLPETRHLIGAKEFAQMKKGVIFINTARGEVVDTVALVAALRDGTVWGAGLDVLEEERHLKEELNVVADQKPDVNYELLTANHVLIDLPNVVVTPHIAFETVEAMHEIDRVTGETISAFISGAEHQYL